MAEFSPHVFAKPPQPLCEVVQVTPRMDGMHLDARYIRLAGWRMTWFHSRDRWPLQNAVAFSFLLRIRDALKCTQSHAHAAPMTWRLIIAERMSRAFENRPTLTLRMNMKARSAIQRIAGVAAGAGALAWAAAVGGVTSQADTEGIATQSIADEGPGYAVEDFAYPNADKILAEQKIKLKRGDGHILLAECTGAPELMEIFSHKQEKVCFRVTGDKGYLSLEIPSVFGVKGNDYAAQVDMSVGAEEKSFTVDRNAWTAVGETADDRGRAFMLLEIRTSK
ncbi:hypothetical protein ACFRSX_29320 [Streptomyces goshikiensis]|uniref:hypothetical protein n=1 Tax=Streptomyces TaxID=1883 RepID=UPI002D77CF6A|nr:hypothetical protein [Streptomyces sp. CB02120-2]